MIKSLPKIIVVLGALGIGIALGSIVSSNAEGIESGNKPGSISDPMVTKSYVDEKVQQIVKSELGKQTVNEQKMQQMLDDFRKELNQKNPSGNNIEVVTVGAKQKLILAEGAEYIVRTGKAVVHSADGSGVSDLTSGLDIQNGKAVEKNHLILVPREGRGVMPDPKQKNGIIVLVRGNYSIEG